MEPYLYYLVCLNSAQGKTLFLSVYGRMGMSRRLLLTVHCTTIKRHFLFSYLETPHLKEDHIEHTMPVSFSLLRLFETFETFFA